MAQDKTVLPTTCLTYLGLTIDTEKQEIRLPQHKITTLTEELSGVLSPDRKKVTLHLLQSIVGKLNFVCKAIPMGRPFLRRFIDAQKSASKPFHRIRITREIREDLHMWLHFLSNHNGKLLILDIDWTDSTTLQLFTDAAGSQGFGAYFQGHWVNGYWPQAWKEQGWLKDITMLELFPIVLAIKLWGRQLAKRRVLFHCDNQAVVSIINKQTAKGTRVMSLLRNLVLLSLQHNVLFKAVYIDTHSNIIADSLSRFQWPRFRTAAPQADQDPTGIPPDVWNL